jgi:hypothetical protein
LHDKPIPSAATAGGRDLSSGTLTTSLWLYCKFKIRTLDGVKVKTTLKLVGGLGNQMFTYVAGVYLAKFLSHTVEFIEGSRSLVGGNISHPNSDLRHLSWGENPSFPIRKSRWSATYLDVVAGLQGKNPLLDSFLSHGPRAYTSRELGYDENVISIAPGKYIRGYFQTDFYYNALAQNNQLEMPSIVNPSSDFVRARQEAADVRPVVMHLRRGDYRISRSDSLLSLDYYREALDHLEKREPLKGRAIWIFSDSKKDATELASGIGKGARVVSDSYTLSVAEDLLLMTEASSTIMSNSTFSWWAAKLSSTSNRVVYPSPWFSNGFNFIQPSTENWVSVDSHWD